LIQLQAGEAKVLQELTQQLPPRLLTEERPAMSGRWGELNQIQVASVFQMVKFIETVVLRRHAWELSALHHAFLRTDF